MLELKNITFDVEDEGQEKEIIRDISLTIPDHCLMVVTGPNGGGKSTLARLIAGIEKPTSGRIYLDGEDITDLSITERARKGIGFAFQQPVRFKGLQVLDLIRLAAGKRLKPVDACEYLSAVGLCAKDYIGREVNASLSGGELKRIEIATVLAKASPLSIFDEPEAGIDLWSFQNLIEVFEGMKNPDKSKPLPGQIISADRQAEEAENPDRQKNSILIISHQERILEIADEIVVIKDGALTEQGPRDEILPGLMGTTDSIKGCWKN